MTTEATATPTTIATAPAAAEATPAVQPAAGSSPAAAPAAQPGSQGAAEKSLAEKFYPSSEPAKPAAEQTPAPAAEVPPPAAAQPPKEGEAKPEGDKPAESTKDGDKPAEDSKEAVKAPEAYELKLPEKSLLAPEHLAGIETFAKANGLSQEAAQKMVERESAVADALFNAQQQQALADAKAWGEQVERDPVMGGENFKATAFYASKGMEIHGSPELAQILNNSGYGNHPAVVKLFSKLGRAAAPDSFERSAALPVEKKSMAERWYGGGEKTSG